MIERAERQDAEQGLRPDDRRCRRADRSVPAADDQKLVAALGNGAAADLVIASADQLDLTVDPRGPQRFRDCLADRGIARRSASAPIDEDRDGRLGW